MRPLAQLSDIDGPLRWIIGAGLLVIILSPVIIALLILNRPKRSKLTPVKDDPRRGFAVLPPTPTDSQSRTPDT